MARPQWLRGRAGGRKRDVRLLGRALRRRMAGAILCELCLPPLPAQGRGPPPLKILPNHATILRFPAPGASTQLPIRVGSDGGGAMGGGHHGSEERSGVGWVGMHGLEEEENRVSLSRGEGKEKKGSNRVGSGRAGETNRVRDRRGASADLEPSWSDALAAT
ncbi:hypothetical protein PVAP13_8NG106101 [Panicum virgatum]|uniref:Uncharacterized protein n=1 Tax=Panicum virgatum TaxID=38727 RepID=A0A8T0P8S3_PANVG|nr:hypothetical protein PVAP13_8NG106101 [Panicum virgatum]